MKILRLAALLSLLTLTACGKVATPTPTSVASPTPTAVPVVVSTPTMRPTLTLPPTLPAATATPTLTPTPVIHIVQEGEVLGAIAYQYGVSVQAIQAANGLENPQYLRVGQELIIPVGEEGEEAPLPGVLLPTPTPLPFVVQGVALYETPVGSLWCLGEVLNTGDTSLTNVEVRVTLLDGNGSPLAQGNTGAAADYIPPGERAPFGLLFTTPPEGWAGQQVAIVRGDAADPVAATYVPIAVQGTEGRPSDNRFTVSGTVQNVSEEQEAGKVRVIVTTYDAQGLVTGFRQGRVTLDGPLPPGATAAFSVTLDFHGGGSPADFHVIAVGRVPQQGG